MLSLLFAASLSVTQAPDTAHVVLVATTDVHGRATAWDYLAERAAPGGLTRVATVVDSLRRRYPGQVVVLDAGDMLQGNAFAAYQARQGRRQPNPIVEAMNLVGYDAATPGNHDFDWGVPELERALADAAFPYVSANLFRVPSDSLLVSPFRVLRRGPIRVGVTGFTTPGRDGVGPGPASREDPRRADRGGRGPHLRGHAALLGSRGRPCPQRDRRTVELRHDGRGRRRRGRHLRDDDGTARRRDRRALAR